jgi:hypothetical protein
MATTFTENRKENISNTSMRRILWAGPLTAVLAGAVNIIVREIAFALGTIPSDLFILQEAGVFISTFVQVLLGAAVFALIIKFAPQPVRTFRIVALWHCGGNSLVTFTNQSDHGRQRYAAYRSDN